MRSVIAAMTASVGLAACTPGEPPAPSQPEPPQTLPGALTYDCKPDRMEVAYSDGGQSEVRVRLSGGAIETLAIDPDNQAGGLVYRAGATTLTLSGSQGVYASGGVNRTCEFMNEDLPAPEVDGVVHALSSADTGKTFEVKVGQKVSVALVGVPTAGYLWAVSAPPAWVKASDGPGGATSTAQRLPGFTGGNHWEVIIIEAVAAGEGMITLAQRRPWEDAAEPDAATFMFTLRAS